MMQGARLSVSSLGGSQRPASPVDLHTVPFQHKPVYSFVSSVPFCSYLLSAFPLDPPPLFSPLPPFCSSSLLPPSRSLSLPLSQVGGRVDLHGMPGSSSSPSWVRLLSPAYAGATSITVNADVSAWPVGSYVALASTSIDLDEGEVAQIKSSKLGYVPPCPSLTGGWSASNTQSFHPS